MSHVSIQRVGNYLHILMGDRVIFITCSYIEAERVANIARGIV